MGGSISTAVTAMYGGDPGAGGTEGGTEGGAAAVAAEWASAESPTASAAAAARWLAAAEAAAARAAVAVVPACCACCVSWSARTPAENEEARAWASTLTGGSSVVRKAKLTAKGTCTGAKMTWNECGTSRAARR